MPIAVFSDAPSADLAELAAAPPAPPSAGARASSRGLRVMWIVDLPLAQARPLVALARAAGVLVNLEDVKAWCDFHNPSIVRRGDLLLTVSTGGQSPGLAARIRRQLEQSFGPEWALRLRAGRAPGVTRLAAPHPIAGRARPPDRCADRPPRLAAAARAPRGVPIR